MTDSDPWSVKQPENDIINRKVVNGDNQSTLRKNSSGFEDSFIPPADNNNSHEHEGSNNSCNNKPEHQPLPDSQTYLKGLGEFEM